MDGKACKYVKENEKIKFLMEQCQEERPCFMAFAETCLKNEIKEVEFEIKGYSHVTSHRKNRKGGGVVIYINDNLTYQTLVSISDEICSIVAIHINEWNAVVFMAYRPPPNNKNIYHGEVLPKSFKKIVIDNIHKVIGRYEAPMPDIILTGDFNFPKASWNAGIGSVNPDGKYNDISL